jgi:hypothetical protein
LLPFHIYKDIPFLLITGDFFFGEFTSWEHIEAHPESFEFRDVLLVPDNNPLECVDEFLQWEEMRKRVNLEPGKHHMLRLQDLRSVASVYSINDQDKEKLLSFKTHEECWKRHRQAFAALNVMWNQVSNNYELIN